MQTLVMATLALLLLTVAIYVHPKIPAYTKGRARVMATRAILMVVGIAFGLLGAADFEGPGEQLLALLIGFGIVHIPAAAILFIKSRRGAGKS